MVLRETAIRVRVRPASRTGAQIRNQFCQLGGAASHFDPDKYFSLRRSDQQIEAVGIRMMLGPAGFEKNMPRHPAALEDEPRRRGELANVFAQKPHRFAGKNSVGAHFGASWVRSQQIALDLAALIRAK